MKIALLLKKSTKKQVFFILFLLFPQQNQIHLYLLGKRQKQYKKHLINLFYLFKKN
jgi:hypothetical protein